MATCTKVKRMLPGLMIWLGFLSVASLEAHCKNVGYCVPCTEAHEWYDNSCTMVTTTTIASRRPTDYDRYKMHDHAQQFPSRCRFKKPLCCPPVPVEDYAPREYTEYTETVWVVEPVPQACTLRILSIYDEGELIQLNDGSLWQIAQCDKQWIRDWALNDAIQISSACDQRYPFRLTNRCNQATVRAIMKAGASRQRNRGCACQDGHEFGTLMHNVDNGDLLQLRDGTVWEIAAYEQIKAQTWREGDKIVIARSGNPVYPFLLKNLNSEETVQACLKVSL